MAAVTPNPIVMPVNNAATQPLITRPANSLWETALQALDEEDKANINFNTSKLDILEDILAAAEEKQQMCLAKRWKYKKGNKEIIIRDQLEKIVAWVDKFKQIGDQIVQYDPGHAALPWAGVRFFLQWTVNDAQVFGTMAEGMELVSGMITRYAIFEKLYLRTLAVSAMKAGAEEHLNEALCKLYAGVLQYLSKAKRYYTRTTTERLLQSATDRQSNLDRYITKISKAKTEVDDCARLIDSAQRHSIVDDAQKLKSLLLQLNDPINRSAVLLSDLHDSLKESERRDMFKWLSTIQYATHHKTMGKDFLLGSGNWLLQKKEFVEWRKESSSSILWLHGIPGSGKSKLIYSVIECINKERSNNRSPAPIAYFYCARNTSEPERADPDEIMRSILKQLSSSTSAVAVREPVAAKYKALKKEADETGCEEPSKLTITECKALVLELLSSNPATIIIDALDECDPARRYELLEVLDNIIQQSSNVVNIFVSSRDDNDIVCRLENSPNVIINATDNGKDIQRFIVSQVDQSIKNKRLLSGRVSGELKQQIINVLTEGAQGMFRWVSLQLQNMCDPQRMKHEGDIRAELGKLPKTLNESYQLIYDQIVNAGETSKQIADRTLKWLLCSKRRLSPSELIAAVTINSDGACITLNERELLDTCCNLLVLDEELKTFRFAHLSVREYLEQLRNLNSIEANTLVVQRCIDVLLFEQQDQSDLAMRQNNMLESYARLYWLFHCQKLGSNPKDGVKNHIKNFIIQNSDLAPPFQKWLLGTKQRVSYEYHYQGDIYSSPPSLLFLTCYYGLTWLMNELDQLKNVSWNQPSQGGNSGLSLAIRRGHAEVVQLLLQRDEVDVNFQCGYKNQTPLLLAADGANEAMTRMLLKRNDLIADIIDEDHYTPLSVAARRGYEAVVRLLLERADVAADHIDGSGKTPLIWAVEREYEAVIRLLLERDDVAVNWRGDGRTPLEIAVLKGYEVGVRLLLERDDVNVNSITGFGDTPLTLAICHNHEVVVRLLLKRNDIDVNFKGFGDTPLTRAVKHGREAVMQTLLEHNDLDVNLADSANMTPLALAADRGRETMVRLLLKHNVDINTINYSGRTPLAQAALNGHEAVVRLLLEREDVMVDWKDNRGNTPGDLAAHYGYPEIVRLLDLKSGVNT